MVITVFDRILAPRAPISISCSRGPLDRGGAIINKITRTQKKI